MALFHVFPANKKYVGVAYSGVLLKHMPTDITYAEFKNFGDACGCASLLAQHTDHHWIVYNSFSEYPMFDTDIPDQK